MSVAENVPGLDALAIATGYIRTMPPAEQWQEIRKFISSDHAFRIELYWQWLGRSLDAFFSDKPNPLQASENCLSAEFKQFIQRSQSKYVLWSLMLFEAEGEITKAIQATNFSYPLPLKKRSDFLKAIALEELDRDVAVYSQQLYESRSGAQTWERWQECIKVVKGEKHPNQSTLKRWQKEDSKLQRDRPNLNREASPLTFFLVDVFEKHHKTLPSFDAWLRAMTPPRPPEMKKFRVINGDVIRSPERGKGKKTKSS